MKLKVRQVLYQPFKPGTVCYLVGDIGGTNANFGIFANNQYPLILLASFHIHSREITDFSLIVADLIKRIQTEHRITITRACFGAAGVVDVHHERAKPTNLDFLIDLMELRTKTGIQTMVLINDFQAVGFGIDYLPAESLVVVIPGLPRANANKAAIGAGTGFGKCIMAHSSYRHGRLVLASEGGHGDFAVQNEFDLAFVDFIRRQLNDATAAISWEDILSGAGIMHLYRFLGETKQYPPTTYTKKIEADGGPDIIFASWQYDKRCRDAYELFSTYYARAAKNFALDALALGGLYIAGGIAANNLDLFRLPGFGKEFLNCLKPQSLLEEIPVIVVTDYNVSLYGGAHFLLLFTGGLPQKNLNRRKQ